MERQPFRQRRPDGRRSTASPPLKNTGGPGMCTSNEDKSKLLYTTFFLPPGPPQPQRPNHAYPEPAFTLRPITNAQIEETIHKLKQYKAPGPDGRLFRASFELKIYPDEWKTSNTVVLRKPDRPHYDVAKAYRPIALINCIAKILSACVTSVLVYEAEKHSLLADHTTVGALGAPHDSLHLITKTVKDAWRSGKVASILFLDIKAAFPSADPECLFHDMRMRGIPEQLTDWLREKLRGRRTKLMFDDYASEAFEIHSGIDQGCPSP
ncbi:putative RNA-directed DNA polymerase from transposon X-element [Grifola frondosa]|uniref:Putative RNA-directed DNA polymerase from transposon X-element n=1 Tax=Grifola frondosa TaxID=5627 RepID=A0A1C7MNC3_GRIFR|nr:putative RNA-directed DNA polymerase from transposon X-element [Grifola frondosa]